ncbi:hypothetical protein ASG45_00425 [Microbacterium sp. Leaf436]|uniref:hypothetical protein n=2 Tax=Microbacterium TaxID=33882 RepID=UPI0007012C05|nr:hypothetical protein [Microbacterium sp. CFBP 13617]KQR88612.1 hypothetical protein ASF96_02205 [Microbacterium sp. Leaf179]KQT75022.1 hypothetical protein ASG45_00425 [Microbacterium sp. Leaf436]
MPDRRLATDDEEGTIMASGTSDPSQPAADENLHDAPDDEGTPKPGGLGADGTIPNDPDGVAAGHSATASHFNPEEDEQSD